MTRLLSLALCLTLAAGCDSQAPCDATTCPPAVPPPTVPPVVVAGVDLTALFAAPTLAERDSVAARIGRAPATEAQPVVSVVATPLRTDPDATRFVRLDLRSETGEALAYALARIPSGSGMLRTVILLPEAPGDITEALFLAGADAQGVESQTVQIVLAYRGATLAARGSDGQTVRFTSAATPDPYRSEVADLLVLGARLGDVPRADPSRLAAIGDGRGGTAVLLAAERAPGRFRVVGTLGAPTSLFDATVRVDARRLLVNGTASTLPSADVLFAPVLALRDGAIGLAEARLRLLALSPVTLADRLPALVSVHALPDGVVPTAHLDRLDEATNTPGAPPRRFTKVEDAFHETLFSDAEARGTLALFLLRNL